jgi:hypothetical protein
MVKPAEVSIQDRARMGYPHPPPLSIESQPYLVVAPNFQKKAKKGGVTRTKQALPGLTGNYVGEGEKDGC